MTDPYRHERTVDLFRRHPERLVIGVVTNNVMTNGQERSVTNIWVQYGYTPEMTQRSSADEHRLYNCGEELDGRIGAARVWSNPGDDISSKVAEKIAKIQYEWADICLSIQVRNPWSPSPAF